jgi:excisionase family DNA binding protein
VDEQWTPRPDTSRHCSRSCHDEDEVHALPVIVDLPTAARALGVGRNTAYELVRSGTWPTPVLRVGRLIKVRRSSLLHLLGIGAVPDGLTTRASADGPRAEPGAHRH